MKALDYVRMLRRRWVLVIAGPVLGLTIATVAALFVPVRMYAHTEVFVSNGLTPVKGNVAPVLASSQYTLDRTSSWAALGRSGRVLEAAIADASLTVDPAGLASRIQVTPRAKTVVLDVSAQDTSGRTAVRMANAVAAALAREIQRVETPPGTKAALVTAWVSRPATADTVRSSSIGTFLPVLGLLIGLGAGLFAAAVADALIAERAERERRTLRAERGEATEPTEPTPADPDADPQRADEQQALPWDEAPFDDEDGDDPFPPRNPPHGEHDVDLRTGRRVPL